LKVNKEARTVSKNLSWNRLAMVFAALALLAAVVAPEIPL
jgi:hypothetical protein